MTAATPSIHPTAPAPSRLVAELRRTFDGAVHLPGDAAYEAGRQTHSGRLDQRPAVVAVAASAADVRAALVAARSHGVPFAVQGTGHGTHVPCDDGVLLKTTRLGAVHVDPQRRVARVGAGARWADVLAAAAPYGLAPLAGDTPTVGVAGFTLGGGVGYLSRAFGLAADSLLAADVVTADGRALRVDAGHHPDLFWALRGGGGSFAVVTALEVRLHHVPQVVAGTARFPRDRAAEVLGAYADGVGRRPDALSTLVVIDSDGVSVRALYAGDPREARRALEPLLAAGGTPLSEDFSTVRFADARVPGVAPRHFELLEDVPVEAVVAAAGRAQAIAVREWGGAIARPEPGAGPAGHRRVPFSVTIDGGPDALQPLLPHVTGGTFLNFTADQSRTTSAFTPANLARLRDLKRSWDPDNALGVTHNIAPSRRRRAA